MTEATDFKREKLFETTAEAFLHLIEELHISAGIEEDNAGFGFCQVRIQSEPAGR